MSSHAQSIGPFRGRPDYMVLLLFFLTGLTGLAYELVWIRLLILAFGSTQFAVTTVLTTFMAGLALGSVIFGRLVDRYPRPLRLYAFIELAIGIYCIVSPSVFDLVRGIYVSTLGQGASEAGFESGQFVLSFLAIIVPTTLMGGTLPLLVKYLASGKGSVGSSTAVAYAVNTLGAVLGAAFTGFFGLYVIGVTRTLFVAGALDVLAGLMLLLLSRGEAAVKGSPAPGKAAPARTTGPWPVVAALFFLSGFASLTYEVLWTRVLSLVMGSSVYAFTLMLSTFLFGIGAGSLAFGPFMERRKDPLVWFFALEAVIALFAVASVFFFKELPFVFYDIKARLADRFWLFMAVEFVLSASVMLVPTLAMGAIFPLVSGIYASDRARVGAGIGDVYFFNTAGSILGAFVAGFLLMPILGVQTAIVLTAGLNLMIALVLLGISGLRAASKAVLAGLVAAAFALLCFNLPAWDRMVMTLGLYSNIYSEKEMEGLERGVHPDRLLFYKEGVNAIITVRQNPDGAISYQANGKMEAMARGQRPAETWALLGHIPLLMHPADPRDALLVGLGSGMTLGAMEKYPLDAIDVVEIEEAVRDAAGFFHEATGDALHDPRVRLHIADGRSFASSSKKDYDIIVSAVSDPWISGVSNLFTLEYFRALDERLADDGVVALWFQNYRIRSEELKIGMATFAEVFPRVSLWFHYTNASDLILIGSKKGHGFDMEWLGARLSEPGVKRALANIDINGPFDVLSLFLMGNDDIRGYAGQAALNTDQNPLLEFRLPKLQYMDPSESVRLIDELVRNVKDPVPPVEMRGDEKAFYLELAKTYNRYGFRMRQALSLFEKAVEIDPSDREARRYVDALRKELSSDGP